jgi:dTDP-4-amino-4,6-dideoxygalactose transaminase
MISLKDYKNPFQAILDFEQAMADYTGAPYCVSTDCCTHAMEIALRLTHDNTMLTFPAHTYLSMPMVLKKLGIPYDMTNQVWREYYVLEGSAVWDCARYLKPNMYVPGSIQCLSFSRTKPLEITRGGCLLTDNQELYESASRMRSDGRNMFKYSPWVTQPEFEIGYHYTLKPEDCVVGLNLLQNRQFIEQRDELYNYPDCRLLTINDAKKIQL